MFLFGHLGIGSKLAAPLRGGLPRPWLLAGTMLPDLIDKPVYYGLAGITGLHGSELGLVSGTRTFGHTAILLVVLTLVSVTRKSKILAALALGTATHLLLDTFSDRMIAPESASSALIALLYPFLGAFVPLPFKNPGEHLSSLFRPFTLCAELVGIAILAWDYWLLNRQGEILARFRRRPRR